MPVEDWRRPTDSTGHLTFDCSTDNQGNAHLLDSMLTTKYPLGVVLMELAHQLHLRRAVLRAQWVPRLQNEEADSLTNEDFRHFDPSRRIEVRLEDLRFGVLNQLLAAGEQYHSEVEALRAADRERRSSAGPAPGGRKRRKAGESLRERDPW